MARKRYSDEDALKILREIDVHLHDVLDGMPKRYSDGSPDPFELQYVNFAIKQLEMLLGEVGRERRYTAATSARRERSARKR